MISIELAPKPQILVSFGAVWGQEYEKSVENGDSTRLARYRHDDVRDALREETRKKCAYCESKLEHVSYSHIEHILPKEKFPLLVCEWSNLTLSCQVCNTNKSDYYDQEAMLLNPYVDEVDLHVVYYGPMVIDRSDRGRLTIAKLKLNRPDLLYQRQEALADVLRIVELVVAHASNAPIKKALMEDLVSKISKEAEYSSCVNKFVHAEAPHRGLSHIEV